MQSDKLLDWSDPAAALHLFDWNPPRNAAADAPAADFATYTRAVLEVRAALALPARPDPFAVDPPAKVDATESGLDIKVFIALTEMAQLASMDFEPSGEWKQTRVTLVLGDARLSDLARPEDSSLPQSARVVNARMQQASARLSEILAQNTEPDRFVLDVVGLPVAQYPYSHALLRAVILGANIFCLRVKERFRVPRPSQVQDPQTKRPVLSLPPVLPLPQHSSFPGGHAMQSAAAAQVLHSLLRIGQDADVQAAQQVQLMTLAARVAENREIAGLHHAIDTQVGLTAGTWFATALLALADQPSTRMFTHLLQEARRECKAVAAAAPPTDMGDDG